MALTQESFRDPRRLYQVRAKSGFFLEGRKPVEPGEIVQVPRSIAAELVHSGKAERVEQTQAAAAPAAPTKPAADPAKEK